ncbi:MAG: hypothetical protein K2Y08_05070 [Alphaproteobacteria bacterium]|nr:hypothetical protein [Alphaproteobacteria bacterium]
MRKTLKFYLVASTIISSAVMGSMAFAGVQERLEDLDKRGLQIALKGVICKFNFPTEEFNFNDPLNMKRVDQVYHFLNEVVFEKKEEYLRKMYALPGVRQNPDFKTLEAKQRKFYDKDSELCDAWSEYLCQESLRQQQMSTALGSSTGAASSSSSGQHSSWIQEYGIDGFDEETLKVAIQVMLNKKNKDAIYGALLSPEGAERKEKVENLLRRLSQGKESLSLEEKQRKISSRMRGVEDNLNSLHLQLLNIEEGISKAQAQREQEAAELEQKRHTLPRKVAVEQKLNELKSLDDFFLAQIREDHGASMRRDKGIIGPAASLHDAMDIYPESVMSITKVVKNNGYVRDLIEKIFDLFQEEGGVGFEAARAKISNKAKEISNIVKETSSEAEGLKYLQIVPHFAGDHSNFPFFERLTSLFCQFVDDPTNLIYSQKDACKNGLYGRIVFNTLLVLKEKLAEGIKNPSQLPAAFFESPHSAAALEEAMRRIQAEDNASHEKYMKFCQKAEEDKRAMEEVIVAKKVELGELRKEMDEISLFARSILIPVGSSSQIEPEVIRPSVKLNPGSFDLVRDDIKGRGLMTPFSFNSPEEGSFKVSGEGTLFYQVLSKPLMDSFVGQKLLLEAEIKSETAGGYLQYFNGIDRIMSYPYSGENGWQKLQLEFTVKDGSRCHIIYPLVMPPKTPGSDIPVVEIRNINLNFVS